MNTKEIKSQLTNALNDKLMSVEMDVTSSFLNGKICSPLLATANNTASYAMASASSIMNTLGKGGLYITKDGLQFDPTVATEAAGQIVNSAISLSMSELIRLKDNALREITYIPDPSIILKNAVSYFSYNIQNDLDINGIMNDLNISVDDENKKEEQKQNFIQKAKESVEGFIENRLPDINSKIENISSNIQNISSYVSQYMSFGPDWVLDKVTYTIGEGSYIAETFLNEKTKLINDWKMTQYDKAAYLLGDQMTKQYEHILKQNVKDLNDEIEIGKKEGLTKAKALIQKANLAIMAKTGVKIPIEKITPENLSKIRQSKQLSELLQLASSASTSNGPESSNDNTLTNSAENAIQVSSTTNETNEINNEELLLIQTKLRYISNRLYTVAGNISDLNIYNSDELYDEEDRVRDVAGDANIYAQYIGYYINNGDNWFVKNIESNKKYGDKWYLIKRPESYDEMMSTINDIIKNRSSFEYKGDFWAFDEEEIKFKKTVNLDNVTVVGTKNNSSIPDMYTQNFMTDETNTNDEDDEDELMTSEETNSNILI